MAAGAREQTASCDAFVLSRRLPAPGAPPSRKSPACLIARTRPSSYLLSPERHLPRMVPAASAAARCETVFRVHAATCTLHHLSVRPWNIRQHVVRCVEHPPVRGTFADMWNIAEAWNIAVRARGVFTHRTGFLKPACVERGLVRTGTEAFGSTKNRLQSEVEGSR